MPDYSHGCSKKSDDSNGGTSLVRARYKIVGRHRQLNREDDDVSITPNLRLREGQTLLGRISTPWTRQPLSVVVRALWADDTYSTTPIWMYLKKGSMASSSDYDKA